MTQKITQQELVFEVETYLAEKYEFRNNILSGKTEMRQKSDGEQTVAEWQILSTAMMNSIIRQAKKDNIGGDNSPRQNIEEYILSNAIPVYNPIKEYLDNLPSWDGKNHVANLFSRIPGINSEQLAWCSTWMRSMVAHWQNPNLLHANETVPILIGEQGCGKSTFANRLLPEHLREYFLDHINFGNKFDRDMALTNNLLVNIDEFDRLGQSQQAHLKQTLSKNKVNGRPIFGKSQDDRSRFASFIATTNNEQPLCDPTGSRRYICLHIPTGAFIENESPINYEQLYAQLVQELNDGIPFWFNSAEVVRIQQANAPFFKSEDLEEMIKQCFRIPKENETAKGILCSDIYKALKTKYPSLLNSKPDSLKVKIGKRLSSNGCKSEHTRNGTVYYVIPLAS